MPPDVPSWPPDVPRLSLEASCLLGPEVIGGQFGVIDLEQDVGVVHRRPVDLEDRTALVLELRTLLVLEERTALALEQRTLLVLVGRTAFQRREQHWFLG